MGFPRQFDFHIHTRCSDGVPSPADVVRLARQSGIEGISITDHDTIDAYREVAGQRPGEAPWILPGLEVSANLRGTETHILGYFPDGLGEPVAEWVEGLLERRKRRVVSAIVLLRERGYDVSWRECAALATGRVVGMIHVAQVLVDKRYLGRTHRAWAGPLSGDIVPPPEDLAADVVRSIGALGGIAVWAHPSAGQLAGGLNELVAAGLEGVEVHVPCRKAAERREMAWAVRERGLLVTGGSDSHGRSARGEVGRFRVADDAVGEFLARIGRQAVGGRAVG